MNKSKIHFQFASRFYRIGRAAEVCIYYSKSPYFTEAEL